MCNGINIRGYAYSEIQGYCRGGNNFVRQKTIKKRTKKARRKYSRLIASNGRDNY
jgi:hypothetical protein